MAGTDRQTPSRRRALAGVTLGALLLACALALPAGAERGAGQSLQLVTTGLGAEKVKTVPISKRSGKKRRVVMSLPPSKLGQVEPGDSVWAGGEVEVSVTCLEPMPKCVGRIYHFSPHVKAKLVLGATGKARGARNTFPLTAAVRQRCSQELPHRNHHCVLTIEGTKDIPDGADLPCSRCHVNLILDVFHQRARKGNVIVVGSDSDGGIAQNKGMLNAGVFKPGPRPGIAPVTTTKPLNRKLPVGRPGSNTPKTVIMSRRVNELQAGERLIVDLRVKVRTGHLPYGTLLQSQLVLSEKRGSNRSRGVPAKITSERVINAQNGFNCTRGKSGHQSPCLIRKVAAIRILRDARKRPKRGEGPFVPLFVNLVMQGKAQSGSHRHRSGDRARVARKGRLAVTRYGPEFLP